MINIFCFWNHHNIIIEAFCYYKLSFDYENEDPVLNCIKKIPPNIIQDSNFTRQLIKVWMFKKCIIKYDLCYTLNK